MTGGGPVAVELVDRADRRWSELAAVIANDPWCSTPMLDVQARVQGGVPALLAGEGPGWRSVQALILSSGGDGRLLARGPDYGGPWLNPAAGVDVDTALAGLHRASGHALLARDVVSEVILLSPLLPHHDAVAAAWGARSEKPICLADLTENKAAWSRLGKGRRADITRARREARIELRLFGRADALRFAGMYAAAMERLDAPERWQRSSDHFEQLADAGICRLCTAESPDGTAAALFTISGASAGYLYAVRSGDIPGGPAAVVWEARERLHASGIAVLVLGGGTTRAAHDPLLRFKRSLSDRQVDLAIAGRALDPAGHAQAIAGGMARPLP